MAAATKLSRTASRRASATRCGVSGLGSQALSAPVTPVVTPVSPLNRPAKALDFCSPSPTEPASKSPPGPFNGGRVASRHRSVLEVAHKTRPSLVEDAVGTATAAAARRRLSRRVWRFNAQAAAEPSSRSQYARTRPSTESATCRCSTTPPSPATTSCEPRWQDDAATAGPRTP